MGADGLDDLVADGEHRIERGHRVLEDHRGGPAAQLRTARCLSAVSTSMPSSVRVLAVTLAGGAEEPHQRQAGDRFAGAGFADDAEALAFVDVKADAAHRFDDTAMLGEARPSGP